MREALGREGWREGEGLPEGWRWRPCPTSGEARLLTREARVVHGARELELVVPEGEEKEQVVRWLRAAGGGVEVEEWREDGGPPEGWRLGQGVGGPVVQDARGVVMGGRREGIQVMIGEHYSPAAIFKVWAGLGEEGWREAPGLPTGWRARRGAFLSPLMEEVGSSSALQAFLAASPDYSQGDLDTFAREHRP